MCSTHLICLFKADIFPYFPTKALFILEKSPKYIPEVSQMIRLHPFSFFVSNIIPPLVTLEQIHPYGLTMQNFAR